MASILLLHPGEMGSSIGAALRASEHTVYWVEENRSNETKSRAYADSLSPMCSLEEGLGVVDMVFSICPPEAALDLALQVHDLDYGGLFIDANAIAPSTAQKISALFEERYVDGGIIGPPARRVGNTRMYLSGVHGQEVVRLFEGTLVNALYVDNSPTSASALKMCYASYTKGTSALLLALRALAEHHGIADALVAEWAVSQPELESRSSYAAPRTSRKGWRFVGEMLEISKTYEEAGLPGDFHQAAAEIYRRMTPFKDQEPAPLNQVIDALLQNNP